MEQKSDLKVTEKSELGAERALPSSSKMNNTVIIAITAILTALECVVTMMIIIPIPSSEGYFNIGESIIYIAAICFGPLVGGFVGGVGAGLADVLSGYGIWAPGTFIIKLIEGIVVGYVFKAIKHSKTINKNWKSLSMVMGSIFCALMITIGYIREDFPDYLGIILGLVLLAISLIFGFKLGKDSAQKLIALIPGGIILVLGYFLYTAYIINSIDASMFENTAAAVTAAISEVPVNTTQFLFSAMIAIPVIGGIEPLLRKFFPED